MFAELAIPALSAADRRGAEEQSAAYLAYPTRPQLVGAREAIAQGMIEYQDSRVIYRPRDEETQRRDGAEIVLEPGQQFDLVEATLYGLNEALVRAEQGIALREEFDRELATFKAHLATEQHLREYGMYAYYPASGDLVHYAPAAVHRLTLVTSNSRLLQDAQLKMSWPEIRTLFDGLTVAVAGASVGNNIAHALAMDPRPRTLKIADPNFFKVSNANRVRLTYRDIVLTNRRKAEERTPFGLKNKVIGAAEQIHALDPFMQVWAYYEGVTPDNVAGFVGGNRVEPRAHYVIEETDNPDTKVFIRRAAREQRVRLIMATDIGSAVQVDIRPFDLDPAAALAVGVSDAELYARQQATRTQPGNREVFWHFVDSLIGVAYRQRGEFGHILAGRLPRMAASIPQLGSTATMAGGIIAEVVARMALGHRYPERFLIDKHTLELQTWGAWV